MSKDPLNTNDLDSQQIMYAHFDQSSYFFFSTLIPLASIISVKSSQRCIAPFNVSQCLNSIRPFRLLSDKHGHCQTV